MMTCFYCIPIDCGFKVMSVLWAIDYINAMYLYFTNPNNIIAMIQNGSNPFAPAASDPAPAATTAPPNPCATAPACGVGESQSVVNGECVCISFPHILYQEPTMLVAAWWTDITTDYDAIFSLLAVLLKTIATVQLLLFAFSEKGTIGRHCAVLAVKMQLFSVLVNPHNSSIFEVIFNFCILYFFHIQTRKFENQRPTNSIMKKVKSATLQKQ